MTKISGFLLLSLLFNLLLPCTVQTGQTPSTYFVAPPEHGSAGFYNENALFQLNVNTKLQWLTNQTFYSIFLFQQQSLARADLSSYIYNRFSQDANRERCSSDLHELSTDKQEGEQESGGFAWNVTIQSFALSRSSVFSSSLALNGDLNGDAFTSHYFNITDTQLPVTTTFSRTDSSSSTTFPTVIAQAESGITAPVNSSSSSTQNIGLGVGIGFGIPIVLLLAGLVAFVCYRNRKRNTSRQQNGQGIEMKMNGDALKENFTADEQYPQLSAPCQPVELSAQGISYKPAELSAHQTYGRS